MIFGNLKDVKCYKFLPEDIMKCLTFALNNELKNLENGTYEINGDRIFVNIIEFETLPKEEKILEAHRKYIDIHLIIRGREKIGINLISNVEFKEYKIENDFVVLDGEIIGNIVLNEDDFMICYPEDVHMPGIMVENREFIKKAVFKIQV